MLPHILQAYGLHVRHTHSLLSRAACRCLFVEYGPMELDLNLRVRVHELQNALTEQVGAAGRRLASRISCSTCRCCHAHATAGCPHDRALQ